MIKINFRKPRAFHTLAGKYQREARKAVSEEMVLAVDLIVDAIEDTPVYTGRTLHNYRFSLGSPIEEVRSAVAQPELPGKTSEMEIGKEPRRAANFAPVLAESEAVKTALKSNPYQRMFMRNNTPYFEEVELGTYKTSEGHTQRTPPGGMVRKAKVLLEQLVRR